MMFKWPKYLRLFIVGLETLVLKGVGYKYNIGIFLIILLGVVHFIKIGIENKIIIGSYFIFFIGY